MVKGRTRYILGNLSGCECDKNPVNENRAWIFHGVSVANLPKQNFNSMLRLDWMELLL